MRSHSAQRCLVLFTKPARPGRVKTRLIGVLTPERAAALHGAFVDDLLPRLRAGDFALRIAWALADGEPLPAAADLRQKGADLGARMHHGLAAAAARHRYVAAVGSDHPELETAIVEEAFARLEAGADVVLGPASDGGYYLVGVRREALAPELFEDVPWSSAETLAATVRNAETLGLEVVYLELGHDVDEAADLERLIERLAGDPGLRARCPHTAALLARWRLLEAVGA